MAGFRYIYIFLCKKRGEKNTLVNVQICAQMFSLIWGGGIERCSTRGVGGGRGRAQRAKEISKYVNVFSYHTEISGKGGFFVKIGVYTLN